MSEKPEDIICPHCGYYCLGRGGLYCIDKPSLQDKVTDETQHIDLTNLRNAANRIKKLKLSFPASTVIYLCKRLEAAEAEIKKMNTVFDEGSGCFSDCPCCEGDGRVPTGGDDYTDCPLWENAQAYNETIKRQQEALDTVQAVANKVFESGFALEIKRALAKAGGE